MDRGLLAEQLQRELAKLAGVRLGVLFGSAARGDGSSRSDVDLAVDGPGVDARELARRLELVLGCPVDVVAANTDQLPLLESIVRDGLVVFEAVPGIGAQWRARSILVLETDLPGYRRMSRAFVRRLARRGLFDGA